MKKIGFYDLYNLVFEQNLTNKSVKKEEDILSPEQKNNVKSDTNIPPSTEEDELSIVTNDTILNYVYIILKKIIDKYPNFQKELGFSDDDAEDMISYFGSGVKDDKKTIKFLRIFAKEIKEDEFPKDASRPIEEQ